MGWALTTLAVALVIIVVAGAALVLCKRYCIGWQWGTRNVWNICEEWRQRLSWLWAPREEKVGLVKAQHPTPQTIPGLYRQSGNNQHLLHSDSDIRLDAQGAFTRFEPVDKDLHPPLSTTSSTIPPQPLRPAPQPRATARPRPAPLQTSSTVDYLRMQESGPCPLTPPPSMQRNHLSSRSTGPSIFHFQTDVPKNYSLHKAATEHSAFRLEPEAPKTMAENIQMASYLTQNHLESRLNRYELSDIENSIDRMNDEYDIRCNPYRQFDDSVETSRIRYRVHGVPITNLDGSGDTDDDSTSYGSYDIIQRSHVILPHARNETGVMPENGFGMTNSTNTVSQTIMESIYGHETLSKMLQGAQSLGNDLDRKSNEAQSIEMTPFRSSSLQEDISLSYLFHEAQGLQRVSQYIQSLPDIPTYDTMNDISMQEQDQILYGDGIQASMNGIKIRPESASSPVPPPPAPPDPPNDTLKKNGPTTGERIFSALRSVTSRSYIDASEFYNSVLSSAQQVQRFAFPTRSSTLVTESSNSRLQDDQDMFDESDTDMIGLDGSKRSSDLYSPELNLEAHRTAQEVYNSLQDPPSSPLLVNDHNQDTYNYVTDSSFMRTPEDILNTLEQQSRKSTERLNGIQDHSEKDNNTEPLKRRNSQEFYAALEELQLKRRLSQSLEDAYLMSYGYSDTSPGSRRGSQGLELEPSLNDSNLKRAISCESVCSDTSVVPNDLKDIPVVGYICVGIEYDRLSDRDGESISNLTVSILEARDLITADGNPAEDTFARVCLLPDTDMHVHTKLYRGSPSPSYQGKFYFPVRGSFAARTLLIEVFSDDSSMSAGVSLIGEATLRLSAVKSQATTWLPLTGSGLVIPQLGELMFSLSYLPTAERLKLVVVKASNLCGEKELNGDFFVKVYLLENGKKIQKKKTSTKKGEKNPIFNEAIIFNVPAQMLENIHVRLTVVETNNEQGSSGKPYTVGHIIVGPSSTGRALLHWKQMLVSLRRPVSMWHPLRI